MFAFYFSRKIPDSKPLSFDLTDFSISFPLSLPLILHFDTFDWSFGHRIWFWSRICHYFITKPPFSGDIPYLCCSSNFKTCLFYVKFQQSHSFQVSLLQDRTTKYWANSKNNFIAKSIFPPRKNSKIHFKSHIINKASILQSQNHTNLAASQRFLYTKT